MKKSLKAINFCGKKSPNGEKRVVTLVNVCNKKSQTSVEKSRKCKFMLKKVTT